MPTYTDQDIQDLLAEFDITVPDLSSRINAVEGKIITVATGADVTDYGQVELIAKLESDAAEGRANTYTDNQLLAAGIDILNQADLDSQSKYDAIEAITKAYTDGVVTSAEEAAAITATAKAELAELNAKAYADGIVTDSEAASIAASEARAELAETLAKAYADGIVTDAEANAIAEAEIKAQTLADIALIAAKDYADSIVVTDSSEFGDFIEIANRDIAILNDKTTDTEVRELLLLAEDTELKYDLQASTFRVGQTESNIVSLNVQTATQATQINQVNVTANGAYAYANNQINASVGYWNGSTWVDGVIAEDIRSLGVVTGDGGYAKVSDIAQAMEDKNGKLIARGGMVTDVNGNLAGYVSTNDGSTSSFDIIATSFRVGQWVNGSFVPYISSYNNKTIFTKGWVNCSVIQTGNGDTFDLNGNPIMTGARFIMGDPTQSNSTTVCQSYLVDSDGTTSRVLNTNKGHIKITPNHTGDAILIASGGLSLKCFKAESGTGQMEVADGYIPFTGKHSYLIPLNPNPDLNIGLLYEGGAVYKHIDVNNSLLYAQLSETPRNPLAIGALAKYETFIDTPDKRLPATNDTIADNMEIDLEAWSETITGITEDDELLLYSTHAAGYINALGEGMLMVCNESGNIKAGQWLCSSSLAGHAMLQTDEETGLYEKYFTDYTIAKSSEDVIWEDEPNDTKLIAVYYKGG